MNESYAIAGKGLKNMFTGQIIALAAIPVMILSPLISIILIMGGGIISIVGLCQAMPAHENYRKAVIMLVAGVVLSVVANLAAGSPVGTFFGAVGDVVSLLQIYFVCTATSILLRELGYEREAASGDLVWKLNAACYLVIIAASVVALVSTLLGGIVAIVTGIVGIAASIIYIVFLNKSYKALLGQ